jgi:hypothetical protein
MTTSHDFGGGSGQPLDTFYLGSNNIMVTALGSCVKWPFHPLLSPHHSNIKCPTKISNRFRLIFTFLTKLHIYLERPHQRRYTSVERHSWNLAGGAAKFQRPPISGMGKKGPGPGIWEEYIRHFVLGCRALPANAISHFFFD